MATHISRGQENYFLSTSLAMTSSIERLKRKCGRIIERGSLGQKQREKKHTSFMQWSYSTAQSTTESYKDLKKTTKKLQSRTYLLRSLLEYTVLMNMGEVNTMNMTEWNTMK